MTSNAIKLGLDRLSSDISARLNEIASQSRDMQVASLVREVERQIPDAQIVVGETPSRSVVDIVNDGDDPAIFASFNDAADGALEPSLATAVATIIERS